jgi:hypothetical protein
MEKRMSEANIRWLLAYVFHLVAACAGPLLCMLALSAFRPQAKFDPAIGPYFWGAAVFGTLLGLLVGRKAKPSILLLLWVIPCLLALWELHAWFKYQYAGQNLKQSLFDNFIGKDCSASECLEEGLLITPLLSTLYYAAAAFIAKLCQRKSPAPARMAMIACTAIALTTTIGCNSTPAPKPATTPAATTHYPARPTTPSPPFTLFHQTPEGSFTLVTNPTATDAEIIAIIYQLRDAAHTRTFDKLGIPQSKVDARDPMVWFHIYRGPKCAAEKYADGKLPCGDHYNASGDYTFGGGPNHQWDDGALLHPTATGNDNQTELWDPNTPYTAPSTN